MESSTDGAGLGSCEGITTVINLLTFLLFTVVAVQGGRYYRSSLRDRRDRALVFGMVWAVWMVFIVYLGAPLVPRQSAPGSIPNPAISPPPEFIFWQYLLLALGPNLLVLFMVVYDVIRSLNQNLSKDR